MNNHPAFITVAQGMSGYFAVMVSWNPSLGGTYDIASSGNGRYKKKEDAVREAKVWADNEEMGYLP